MNKKQVTFWIEDIIKEKFSKKYHTSMSKFFRNCVLLALEDNQFFHDVFFMNDFNSETKKDIPIQNSIF